MREKYIDYDLDLRPPSMISNQVLINLSEFQVKSQVMKMGDSSPTRISPKDMSQHVCWLATMSILDDVADKPLFKSTHTPRVTIIIDRWQSTTSNHRGHTSSAK